MQSYLSKSEQPSASNPSYYWQYYKLTKNPFALTHESEMAYLPPKWEAHLDLIHHLINTKNILIAVVGQKGTGKTKLMQQFSMQFDDSLKIHHAKAEPTWDNKKLINTLYQGFQLKKQMGDFAKEELETIVTHIQYAKTNHVLVIDNAENLSLEILKSLAFMLEQQSHHQMRLHIILSGNLELQNNLQDLSNALDINQNSNQGSNKLIHAIHLSPFTLQETTDYLHHLFIKAGAINNFPLTASEINRIYKKSAGVPAIINNFAEKYLIKKVTIKQTTQPIKFLHMNQNKLLGGLVVVGLFVAVTISLSKQNAHPLLINHLVKSIHADVKSGQTVPMIKQLQKTTVSQKNINTYETVKPIVVTPQNQLTKQSGTISVTKNISENTSSTTASSKPTSQPSMKKFLEIHVTKSERTPKQPATKTTTSWLPSIQKSSGEDAEQSFPGQQATQKKLAIIKLPIDNSSTKKVDSNTLISFTVSKKHLLALNKNFYTLQILASRNRDALQKFMNDHHLNNHLLNKNIYYYRKKNKYILLYGIFSSYEKAMKARKNLPLALQNLKPWTRNIASVQYDILQQS